MVAVNPYKELDIYTPVSTTQFSYVFRAEWGEPLNSLRRADVALIDVIRLSALRKILEHLIK